MADWFEDINAFGVQAWKKAKHGGDPGNLSLLFKSVQVHNMALRQFRAKAPPGCNRQYFEGLTLMDPEAALTAHVSNLDLGYINQAYAYKSQFFPEILSFAPPAYRKAMTAHHFFDSKWFPPGKKDIRVNIWPTDGPYDEILRILTCLAHDVYGSSATQPLLDETFGFPHTALHSIPPQCGFRVMRKTTTMLFSVPFHLEWRVSEHKFSVSPLALTPWRMLQVVIFISGSSLLQYATQEKPLPTTSQPSGSHATSPNPSRTSLTRLVVEIPSWRVLTAPYTSNEISNKPTSTSSPFGYLSVSSSACTPIADFDSNDEDFGMPFGHDLEDGQASVTQGDDGFYTTGDSFFDSINAGGVPAYHGPKSFSCDTDKRNQHEVSSPGLLDIQSPPYYDHVIPNHHDTPIHSPHPDSPDTPILDITDGTHDDFLLSDDDSDDLVPLKVRGNAKPRPKAVVSPQPISQLSEEPSLGEDDEDLKGGLFTIPEVEKIKAEYTVFDNYPTNPDKSVSQSDYTKNTVCPAYDELVKKYGGERSEDWAAESTCMVKEYTETREAITGDIAKHGGEVAKIIASHKRAWQKDFRVLASFGVHCKLTVLADNACSPAAHAQNGQLFRTVEMESYYKSRRDFKSHVGDVYTFILSAKAGVREAEEHKARTFSLSIDHYNVSEIQAMYNALENGQLKVSECPHEESNSGETTLITDSGGQVLMTVKKLDSQRAAEWAVVRAQAVDKRIDDRIATQGLGKRPRKGGDDINQPRKMKHLQVKSAEFIDDLDETPTAGPSHLHMQAMSSHHNDVQQHSALSIDSGATVGVPLQHTTGVPVVPTFNPHDPFSMMDDVPIPNGDNMSFPLLDPLLFQGPEFEALVAQYQSRYEVDRFY
ncbi:hypothetical protein BS47DRAFT_1361377 [Hydnum rufescens UP504]|uniref:Uncharacterized protein n=1 Tax=Hydnum rufescens UP504 TaxID=1448309 RepID=A0A9P6DXL1_9AGAM|nr:hypothetical protein BS47DRAFT_1361377 [Hydnum rufescens UP504]